MTFKLMLSSDGREQLTKAFKIILLQIANRPCVVYSERKHVMVNKIVVILLFYSICNSIFLRYTCIIFITYKTISSN